MLELRYYGCITKKERKKKKPAGVPPQSPSRGAGALQDKTEPENS